MSNAFGRLLKWLFSMTLMVIGLRFLMMASENNDVRPIIICIFSFGGVYLLYRTRADIPRMIGILTGGVFLAAYFAAEYLFFDVPILNYGFFMAWWAWTMMIGIPVMFLGFLKFG